MPDRLPSSLAGSHAFRTLNRHTLGVVTQARTGNGHFGEYYQAHNVQEPVTCPCGAGLQTREQVFECQAHEEHWNIIDEGAPDHQLATTLRYGGPGRVCQEKQGVPKTKDPNKPIGILAAKRRGRRAQGAKGQGDAPNRSAIQPTPSQQ